MDNNKDKPVKYLKVVAGLVQNCPKKYDHLRAEFCVSSCQHMGGKIPGFVGCRHPEAVNQLEERV